MAAFSQGVIISMKLLFLHPNFPGQYLHLARYYARTGRDQVMFLTKETHQNRLWNVDVGVYKAARETTEGVHPYVKQLEAAALEGQAVARGIISLQQRLDFTPDVVIGHAGWGSTLYVKDLLPTTPLIGYFEWYYHAYGSDVGYWPEEKVSENTRMRIRTQNATSLLALDASDVRYTPTEWQKKQFPAEYQPSLRVAHEGVDTSYYQPDWGAKLRLSSGLDLSDVSELVTYVSRGMEPYRGFPQFMETVRILLARRPKCHVVIVGEDRSCYSPPPEGGKTWKQLEEERGGYDAARVHFTGRLPWEDYRRVLQASSVHVYLTRPFVLSWSMLESMAAGCCLVASATPPVQEVVTDGENGLLADFRTPAQIADRIEEALDDERLRHRLSAAAVATARERYDVKKCLARQVAMVNEAAAMKG